MKPLIGDTAQKSEAKPQGNGGNRLQKRSAKMLMGAAAILIVIAIVVATSFVTASILSRQGNNPRHQPAIVTPTMPPDVSADSAFIPELNPTPPYTQQSTGNVILPATIAPRSPARTGGPANPPISAQSAAELARDHLISIGVKDARFDYVYMDIEHGTWVWSVEFDGQGGSYEFYVDVNTGDFLKATQGTATENSPAANPTPSPQPTASPSASGQGNRPSNPTISLERAIEIAYANIAARGINASFRSDSGMSWERGQWVWELLFSTRGERMPLIEYYINVDDGRIVKFEWDD